LDGFLLETTTLSAMLDPSRAKHVAARDFVAALDPAAPKFVSAVALAELMFGQRLMEAFAGASPPTLARILSQAQVHAVLDVTRHTAAEYGELKANLAKAYLAKAFRRDRPRWLENWVDKATGQILQVDENDLWMCAQARERNLVLITADARMSRVSHADTAVRLQII
jgi:predicted nucleic acid-binding protein